MILFHFLDEIEDFFSRSFEQVTNGNFQWPARALIGQLSHPIHSHSLGHQLSLRCQEMKNFRSINIVMILSCQLVPDIFCICQILNCCQLFQAMINPNYLIYCSGCHLYIANLKSQCPTQPYQYPCHHQVAVHIATSHTLPLNPHHHHL